MIPRSHAPTGSIHRRRLPATCTTAGALLWRTAVLSSLLAAWTTVFLGLTATTAHAQRPVTEFGDVRLVPAGVLGSVPFTPADSTVQRLVDRLDFDVYVSLIRGLADFGDREQGTARNVRANEWIEARLRSWGYETERMHYEFSGEPRWQVFATKWGTTSPEEMYLVGAHMDGRGSDPHWHRPSDLFVTYSEADFRLGFNAVQTTLGAVGRLVGARIDADPR